MRALLKIGLALLVLAFVLIGASYGMLRSQGISGPATTAGRMAGSEVRTVSKRISAVELSGPIDLSLRYGQEPSLVVRGEQRLLGNVETVEDGGVLHIGTRGIVLRHRRPLQVTLVLPSLTRLTIDGSGDSKIDGFSGERVELRLDGSGTAKFNGRYRQVSAILHGSGDLELESGNSDKLVAEINGSGELTLVGGAKDFRGMLRGSGDLDARHLRADVVEIEQVGSGNSTVFARNSVTASLSGTGDIEVLGDPPQRSVSRNGSGEVIFRTE
ncbi:head GIN domain-containing protein [Massilia horti]|uniref:DUF2807 domain-containing protein n=1 Tax=Massilia horti TaxID=2562153 RepID=A0A4Y9SUA9_9BURK|nr:head GIN domain-containing protein [Massilia horti]TFW28909.1 DUF2807 domain-containing protein [Massilia horti]